MRCICAEVPRVATATRFVVLRHVREINHGSNTGRLAAMAMPNLDLVDYGAEGRPLEWAVLGVPPDAWLLFPGGGDPVPAEPPPSTVVVLDATWSQARRMLGRVTPLKGLRRLSLPPPPVRPRMRTPRLKEGMATLEAIAAAVAWLEGPATAAPLFDLFTEQVERVAEAKGFRPEPKEPWA